MTSRQYYLTDHVRACACSGLVILMDVRSNRYLSVSGQLAYCLALLVRDWPMSPEGTLSNDDAHSVEDGLRDLLSRGILTTDPPRSARYRELPKAVAASLDGGGTVPCPLRVRLAITWSVVRAKLQLRFLSLETLLRRLQRTPSSTDVTDPRLVTSAVRQYRSTRHLLVSAEGHCFLDSLALLLFLRSRGIRPDWVFGVQAAPFAAHCWLQLDDLLLNDDIENVTQYVPILVT